MYRLFYLHIFICISVFALNAQDFQGKATYQSKTGSDLNFEGRQLSEDQKKRIAQRMKRVLEKRYQLVFDRTASLYFVEEVLDAPSSTGGGRGFRFNLADMDEGLYYKNIQQKTYANQKELYGKTFLVQDSLTAWEWKLGSETKTIGKYTCYKATATLQRDTTLQNLQGFGRDRTRRANTSSQETITSDSINNNKTITVDPPKERRVTAWYTPQIPVSQGPGPYWGLPGLILEINDGRTTILCNSITLNLEDKTVLEAPSKGKKVDQATYNKIWTEKMSEMRENFRQERGGRNGGRNRG